MKYPGWPEFSEIYDFSNRFKIDIDPERHTFVAKDSLYENVTYELSFDRAQILEVRSMEGGTKETPLDTRQIKVQNAQEFAWKLFCLLKKNRLLF